MFWLIILILFTKIKGELPSFEPTIQTTPHIVGICANYFTNNEFITGETCTGCDLCGDGMKSNYLLIGF